MMSQTQSPQNTAGYCDYKHNSFTSKIDG